MAKKSDEFDEFLDAVELKEPDGSDDGPDDDDLEPVNGIWMRGVMMLILAAMFGLAQTVLAMVALVQFIWMLITKEKNQLLAEFGRDLAAWLAITARFQSGASEDKPFPWTKWS